MEDQDTMKPTSTRLPTVEQKDHDGNKKSVAFHTSRIRICDSTSPNASDNLFSDEQGSESVQGTIIIAWAYLLRLYLLQDQVSFFISSNGYRQLLSFPTPVNLENQEKGVLERMLAGKEVDQICNKNSSQEIGDESENLANSEIVFADEAAQDSHEATNYYVLHVQSSSQKVDVQLLYNENAVPPQFADLVGQNLRRVITQLMHDQSNIKEIQVSEADVKLLSAISNRVPFDPSSHTLHDLFKSSATKYPERQAIDAWDGTKTYREVEELSDNIARRLVEEGIKVGDAVPFCFEKSLWVGIAILAILKAGASFVALDPSSPTSRIHQILDATEARLVIVSPSQSDKFSELHASIWRLEPDYCRSMNHDSTFEFPQVKPADNAVVLFTSGSTGTPKGIVLQHQAVCNHLLAVGKSLKYQDCRLLQFSAHTWDVFVIDVFTTWLYQGCICVPSDEQRISDIVGAFLKFKADLAMLTPSCASLLKPGRIPSLTKLILGGEALTQDITDVWRSSDHGVHCSQMYGPAEVGICIAGDQSFRNQQANCLGYALDNFVCIITDPDDPSRLVPPGTIGELLVGGPAVAESYLKMPGKTKESFIKSPGWVELLNLPVTEFYRTGDLVTYDISSLDGRFNFVGRRDTQIKFNGQRLELGEIEQCLSKVESVDSCVALVAADGAYKGSLVAVVSRNSHTNQANEGVAIEHNSPINEENAKQLLLSKLPRYMVPTHIITVDHIPQKVSMKVDRKDVQQWLDNLKADHPAPEAKEEAEELIGNDESTARQVAEKISDILDENSTNKSMENANLRDKGLSSINLMSLSMFISDKYGKKIPTEVMMRSDITVRSLARIIDGYDAEEARPSQQSEPEVETEVQTLVDDLIKYSSHEYNLPSPKTNVLLTGVTSFLGQNILQQLLQSSEVKIFGLVRDTQDDTSEGRLRKQVQGSDWWESGFQSRLHVWSGDLELPRLGLEDKYWQRLTAPDRVDNGIHMIIHAGALVNYTMDFATARKTNINSLFELLRATASPSTAIRKFVFVSGGQELEYTDEKTKADTNEHLGGYTRSKLISEQLIQACSEMEIFTHCEFSTVLPGYIIGNVRNSKPNKNDFIWRLVAACADMGEYDQGNDNHWIAVSSAEHVASKVVDTCLNPSKSFVKILEGIYASTLWEILADFGINIHGLPREQWTDKIEHTIKDQKDSHPLFAFGDASETDSYAIGIETQGATESEHSKAAVASNIRSLIDMGLIKCYPKTVESGSEDDV